MAALALLIGEPLLAREHAPALVWCSLLALGGLGLAASLARWPGRALYCWLPGLAFGL